MRARTTTPSLVVSSFSFTHGTASCVDTAAPAVGAGFFRISCSLVACCYGPEESYHSCCRSFLKSSSPPPRVPPSLSFSHFLSVLLLPRRRYAGTTVIWQDAPTFGGEADGLLIRTIDQMSVREAAALTPLLLLPAASTGSCLPAADGEEANDAANTIRYFVVCRKKRRVLQRRCGEKAAEASMPCGFSLVLLIAADFLHSSIVLFGCSQQAAPAGGPSSATTATAGGGGTDGGGSSVAAGGIGGGVGGAPSSSHPFPSLATSSGHGFAFAPFPVDAGAGGAGGAGGLLRGFSTQRIPSLSSEDLVSFQLQFQQAFLEQQNSIPAGAGGAGGGGGAFASAAAASGGGAGSSGGGGGLLGEPSSGFASALRAQQLAQLQQQLSQAPAATLEQLIGMQQPAGGEEGGLGGGILHHQHQQQGAAVPPPPQMGGSAVAAGGVGGGRGGPGRYAQAAAAGEKDGASERRLPRVAVGTLPPECVCFLSPAVC